MNRSIFHRQLRYSGLYRNLRGILIYIHTYTSDIVVFPQTSVTQPAVIWFECELCYFKICITLNYGLDTLTNSSLLCH